MERLDRARLTRHSKEMEKTFTIEEATRTLPLVSRIVDDLVRGHRSWEDKVREFELATVGSSPERPDAMAELLQIEAQRLAVEIEGYVAELTALGVACKSMDTGLVDFPGLRDGKRVYYCWMLGEAKVQYWHELDAGFVGRQKIDTALVESR